MRPELIGYASSTVLLMTLGSQIHKQWKSGTSRGVSPWLFVGQLAASAGFVAYSALIRNRVFVITNTCLALAALIGICIVARHRHRDRHSAPPEIDITPRAAPPRPCPRPVRRWASGNPLPGAGGPR